MFNSIKTEIKTILHMKSIWFCVVVLLIISMVYLGQSYISAENAIAYNATVLCELEEFASDTELIDTTSIEKVLYELYKTYHPSMSINNSLGVLLGLGLIIVPVISSLYMGIEYSRNGVIKYKITHATLTKTYLSKIIIILFFIVAILLIYILSSFILSSIYWNNLSQSFSNISIADFSKVSFFSVKENIIIVLLVSGILAFYSIITMIVSAFMKNSTYGIITVIAINYIVIPSSYSPHNIIFSMINSLIYTSSASPYEFVQSNVVPLSLPIATFVFVGYFALAIAFLLIIGKLQKNS